MATHASSKSIPVSGAQPRSVAIPTVSVHPAAPGIPAPQPLRASNGHVAVVARYALAVWLHRSLSCVRPAKKPDPEAELEQIMFPPEEVERDDEDIPKEELVTLGTTPSPAPTPSEFPFSPPSRVFNPMIQNSPFQRESMLDSSPPGGAPGRCVYYLSRCCMTMLTWSPLTASPVRSAPAKPSVAVESAR